MGKRKSFILHCINLVIGVVVELEEDEILCCIDRVSIVWPSEHK